MSRNLPDIDPTVPSIARVYDAFLGGKDHYEVDRQVLTEILKIAPEAPRIGRECRAWLIRVVRFLAASAGIDQFLDVGSGLPTAENTHQAVQRINAEAQVVYVDNDPMVAAHGRALLEENDRTHFVVGDLRHPAELLKDPVVSRYLDWTRPIGLIQSNTVHHVADEYQPNQVMAAYIDSLPSGSYVAISHLHNPDDGSDRAELAKESEAKYMAMMGSCHFRTRERIASYFTGLEMVEPGLTYLFEWWPDGPRMTEPATGEYLLLGGVGRKP
ncbi:SAM-dependent methyltransferase [Actinocrispum wychmicini]|uniref:S-adenosyl methyltransferase n=1 Tax=Actinocrispum wychmicini TaxID=1213861 RepID=A0A4R2IR39_9PSEU|nr:SAM-dependent methyltransferase [Actinocrispum wychmicini]TCO46559.1 S-adenosyl methyltransferase [Actinocrispum wychmicini]